jgi:hypothetical protein
MPLHPIPSEFLYTYKENFFLFFISAGGLPYLGRVSIFWFPFPGPYPVILFRRRAIDLKKQQKIFTVT